MADPTPADWKQVRLDLGRRLVQCTRGLITTITLGFFVGLHRVIDWCFSWAFESSPKALATARGAFAAAFLLVAFALAVEIVEVFIPVDRLMKRLLPAAQDAPASTESAPDVPAE